MNPGSRRERNKHERSKTENVRKVRENQRETEIRYSSARPAPKVPWEVKKKQLEVEFRACSRGKKWRHCCGKNEFGGLHYGGVLTLQMVWLYHGGILISILGCLYYGEIFVNVGRSALLRNFDISIGRAEQKSVPCNVEFG